jgi:hypothetical protein
MKDERESRMSWSALLPRRRYEEGRKRVRKSSLSNVSPTFILFVLIGIVARKQVDVGTDDVT